MRKKKIDLPTGDGTVIGKGTVVNGSIESDAVFIRIDGELKGNVNTKGDLTVGPDGIVNGDITANSLNLAGKVNGNVVSKTKLEIESKGVLTGDVTTDTLVMDASGIINGKITMKTGNEESAGKSDAADDNGDKVKVAEE